jgi:uncharacterized protein YqcC (DUF446 family)
MNDKIRSLLNEVKLIMEKAGEWQTLAPSPEKMMSTEPFSIDTLTFLEWLQWVYFARLMAILDSKGVLPSGAQVLPYAEEALKASGKSMPKLLTAIKQLDDALS